MSEDERHAHILNLLARQETASLEEIRQLTAASPATVRRDLATLADQGLLRRTRGGASLIPVASTLDETFTLRRRRSARDKGAIAVATAALIPPGSAVFLNDGSTTFALSEELAGRGGPLWFATSALNIAARLAGVATFDVNVIGGSLRGSSFATSGPMATAALGRFTADFAVLGCDGLDLDSGVGWNSLADAEIAQVMARRAARTIVVADAGKFDRPARVGALGWDDVDDLVTNAVDHDWSAHLKTAGVHVTIA
ncbi:transcriptional regulator [Acrocarpospora corrugata]|uniref:Lactose phosphotransferase system repressor n=1 Tax=Acrocarpospora corrugata TaxID=35763 RepID=A0A5M3VW72_9ACTN|nr:DeoR/GlpR family DNA-binding transcription regulator [Acrocarpospora corrugata]GES00746.1 transcriptional regulator [Acrocarpospora corrugata]